jgi:hypothetical protein
VRPKQTIKKKQQKQKPVLGYEKKNKINIVLNFGLLLYASISLII